MRRRMINGEEENALLMVNGLLLARTHGAVMNQKANGGTAKILGVHWWKLG